MHACQGLGTAEEQLIPVEKNTKQTHSWLKLQL